MSKKGILDKIVYVKLCFTTGMGNVGLIVDSFYKVTVLAGAIKTLTTFSDLTIIYSVAFAGLCIVGWSGHLYLQKGFFEREQGIIAGKNPAFRELLENTKHEDSK